MELARVSHTHDQIMNWLIANPEKKLGECAAYFGYTQSWLSTLIHSDTFKAKFRERQDAVFGRIAATTEEKLAGLANMVTDRLAEKVEVTQDGDFILDAFDKIMHRAGYAPNKMGAMTPPQVQNNFFISKDALAAARGRIGGEAAPAVPATIEGVATVIPSTRGAADAGSGS